MSEPSIRDDNTLAQHQDDKVQKKPTDDRGDNDAASESAELSGPPTKDGKQSADLETDTKSLIEPGVGSDPVDAFLTATSDSMPAKEYPNEEDEGMPYPEPTSTLLHPSDFRPFFPLIEDTATDTQHHPTVHYLFSDDDSDILTAAALEILSDEQHEVEERFVVVDMSADGKEVVATSSFSPEWQALRTRVTQAPSWGDQTMAGDRGLMLRIEGREMGSGQRARKGDINGLLQRFDQAMGGLDEALGNKAAQEESGHASR
ncbi:unnamed protein product [Zymoseptoria tritici ST99CH_3D1]|uniref:Uncharacterized protein n=1 Tax=Zymoseptoria tritici (strain ST99CH_3D7) TaxID=1276538 RepID=A0A1X7RRH0_ZYMT9|nr:unnamed protein product [Zymoseptoria tritici ST99CH_3D7]SMR51964.1 unnamed protein product [Zymoseptoria tritici ST99CH_3D1]